MVEIEEYKKRFAELLAKSGSLFFGEGLVLKDKRPTPYFVNMGIFNSGELIDQLGEFYADMFMEKGYADKADIIFGPSYKGSAIAVAMVSSLWKKHKVNKLFVYDRKEAKTHGEATKKGSMWVGAKFFDGCRVYLVDDVGTSMATKYEAIEMFKAEEERAGIKINLVGVGLGVDRQQTTAVYNETGAVVLDKKGENAIGNFVKKSGTPVDSVVGIKEVIGYLHEENIPVKINGEMRPFDDKTKKVFDDYIETYGVEE